MMKTQLQNQSQRLNVLTPGASNKNLVILIINIWCIIYLYGGDEMKCPRCGVNELKPKLASNALSRKDNKTYICSDCGIQEALFDIDTDIG